MGWKILEALLSTDLKPVASLAAGMSIGYMNMYTLPEGMLYVKYWCLLGNV